MLTHHLKHFKYDSHSKIFFPTVVEDFCYTPKIALKDPGVQTSLLLHKRTHKILPEKINRLLLKLGHMRYLKLKLEYGIIYFCETKVQNIIRFLSDEIL